MKTIEAIEVKTQHAEPRLNYVAAAPAILPAMRGVQKVVNESGLERSLLNLVTLRASQLNRCAFCIEMHVREARELGETEERLHLLDAWQEVSIYTPRERAALRWTEALTRLSSGSVTDDDFAEAREQFSESELALLSLAIVTINGWNRLNVGFRIPPRFGN